MGQATKVMTSFELPAPLLINPLMVPLTLGRRTCQLGQASLHSRPANASGLADSNCQLAMAGKQANNLDNPSELRKGIWMGFWMGFGHMGWSALGR